MGVASKLYNEGIHPNLQLSLVMRRYEHPPKRRNVV